MFDSSLKVVCKQYRTFSCCRSPSNKSMCHTVRLYALLSIVIGFFDGQNAAPNTETFCGNTNAMLSCPKLGRDTFITIRTVVYGRQNTNICPTQLMSPTSCVSPSATATVKTLCEGQTSCAFAVTNNVFTDDPCPGKSKYLSITYECLTTITVTACQDDSLNINCPKPGTVIFLEDVIYGRQSIDVCPRNPMPSVNCKSDNALVAVKARCENKTSCSLLSTLEDINVADPCVGTTKYLSVEYACVQESSEFACGGSTMNINCPTAGTLILIRNAIYGRISEQVCVEAPMPSTTCNSALALGIAEDKCNGKNTCSLPSNLADLGNVDPCVGTTKYLSVDYECVPAMTAIVCEGSRLSLNCPIPGTVILIRLVMYGRKDPAVCPVQPITNNNCNTDAAFSIIQDECDGETSCSYPTSALGVADPCPGTTKYLSVTYSCVPDCETPCATCTASDICTSCVPGYYLDVNNICRACRVCGSFEYESEKCGFRNRQCKACPSSCETCYNATACKSCKCGEYLDSTYQCRVCKSCAANQYEAQACSNSADRQCFDCSTCSVGNFTSTPCSRLADTVCSVCRECQTNSFESAPCTSLTNRQCSACRTCPPNQYETTECNPTRDRVCTACRICTANQYQLSPCTNTTNRVCSACRNCATGQYASTPCSSSTDAVCSACRTCEAGQYESTPCTSSTNRQCSDCRTCAANQYESVTCTLTTNRQCLACRTCAASQYESAPCTGTTNRQCSDIAGVRCADRTFFNRYQRQCLPWLCSRPMYRDRLFRSACNDFLRN